MDKVNFCNPPLYDEIGVSALYSKVVMMPGMSKYFPDKFPKGRQCCRTYMYNIWNTLHPADVKQVIQHANNKRYSVNSDRVKEETIVITD